jgi:uncharacterized protein (TIRG00374 family)
MNSEKLHIKTGRKKKRFSPFLLIRLLGIAVFIYILSTVDLKVLWENIKDVNTAFLFYGIAFQVLLLFLKAIRWHILNSGSRKCPEVMRSFGEFFESYAIGVITPGRIGEMVKAGHAKEKNRIMETGLRVIIERGFDFGIFVSVAALALIYAFPGKGVVPLGILILLGGILIFSIAIVFLRSASATRFAQKILNKLPFLKLNLQLAFKKRSNTIQLLIILLSIAGNLSYFVSCYFLAAGLSIESSILYISGAVAVAGLLNMLPITVMGLGTREATFLLLFKPLAEPLILAFSSLVFLVAQIGGGLISLILGQLFLYATRKKDRNK